MSKRPNAAEKPRFRVQKVRKVYVGGKREEAQIAGIVGFIGHFIEVSGSDCVLPSNEPHYIRARKAYYLLHPDHPGHPQWRPEYDEKFAAALSEKARDVYSRTLYAAVHKWQADHPEVRPVHPESADWDPAWDRLKFDPDKIRFPRYAFMRLHEAEFRAVPGLWEAVRGQLHHFMREFYQVMEYGD